MIEILILYTLNRYDATIYKIAKLIETIFFAYAKPSFGTINPALRRLEALECVEFISKITEGGKSSKLYSIKPFGLKYLKSLMLDLPLNNPSVILNNSSILLFCADILDLNERKELLKNVSNWLTIYKNEIEKKLDDPYIDFTEAQRAILKTTHSQVNSLVLKCL